MSTENALKKAKNNIKRKSMHGKAIFSARGSTDDIVIQRTSTTPTTPSTSPLTSSQDSQLTPDVSAELSLSSSPSPIPSKLSLDGVGDRCPSPISNDENTSGGLTPKAKYTKSRKDRSESVVDDGDDDEGGGGEGKKKMKKIKNLGKKKKTKKSSDSKDNESEETPKTPKGQHPPSFQLQRSSSTSSPPSSSSFLTSSNPSLPLNQSAGQVQVQKGGEGQEREGKWGLMLWDFEKSMEGEVSAPKDEYVYIVESPSSEWFGVYVAETTIDIYGYVPTAYVRVLDETEIVPDEVLKASNSGSFSSLPISLSSSSSSASLSSSTSSTSFLPSPLPSTFSSSSSSTSLSSSSSSQPEDNMTKRRKIVGEILSTEKAYYDSLSKITEIYKAELTRLSKDSTTEVTIETVKSIFCNVDSIRSLSLSMVDSLTGRIENWSEVATIGDIFVKMAPIMIIYTEFANAYEEGLQAYLKEKKRNKVFEQAVLECKKKAELDLEHLLIMPVQRIPRYNLLLNDLIRNTEEDHPDYETLKKAFTSCQSMATRINECMRRKEKVQEMSNLVEKSSLFKTLLQSDRQLRLQQHSICTRVALEMIGGGSHEEKERALAIVFNDLFVYVPKKALTSPDPIKSSFVVPLNLVWIDNVEGTTLNVQIPGYSLLIGLDDKKEKSSTLASVLSKSVNEYLASYWAKTWEPKQEKMRERKGKEKKKAISDALAAWGSGGGGDVDLYSTRAEDLSPNYPYRHGKYKFVGGAEYEGWWKEGAAHGEGIYSYQENQYIGNFHHGVQSGYGVCSYFVGDYYEGQWANNMANGEGKLITLHGDQFHGTFCDNLKEGHGEVQYANGDKFTGEWKKDYPHGHGELTMSNGLVYIGDFKEGNFDGKGILWSPTGKCYRGTWVNHTRQGTGVMTYGDGSTYAGMWANNNYHGWGTFNNLSDGTSYAGTWVHGVKEGEGSMCYSDGSLYSGQFKVNLRHGRGYCSFANQEIYMGQWRHDKFNGRGKLIKSNGVSYDGNFTNGLLEGSCTLITLSDQVSRNFKPSNISEGKLNVECVPRVPEFKFEF